MKKLLLSLGLAAATLLLAAPVLAQTTTEYPAKPIRMLLPFSAGGGGDAIGRMLAQRMGKLLKQNIYVENKTGAGGIIGTHAVATSPADGYTITIGGMTTHVLAPASYAKLPYDPVKDFSVVGRIGASSIVLVATNDFPANNLKDFIALAKAKPGAVQYASWGQGSTGHFCGEVLAQKAGLSLQHVPYKGTTQVVTDMLGGHISLGMIDMATGTPFIRDGKLKALAVCTQRSPSLPNVASYKEQGVDFDQTLTWVMYVPAGVPKPIVEKLAAALQASLKEPEVISQLLALGVTADFVPGEQQAAINARDIQVWRKVAQEAHIQMD
jgi:tripartite-type tricarboxylate transporter receptor subunit TctC